MADFVQAPEQDVVISSRVRLARNYQDIPFSPKLTREAAEEVISRAHEAMKNSPEGGAFSLLRVNDLGDDERRRLVEHHLISYDLLKYPQRSAALISSGETVSVMLNEEDHLRIQGLLPGMQLERSAELAFNADDALGAQNVYAFDPQWGYLTSCPTNVGTGMRASAMLHLPAITQNGQIGAIMQAVAKLGLTVRGLYGEGSEAQGDLYQLSNQVTLGRSEEDVIRSLQAATEQIVGHERTMRERAEKKDMYALQDKLLRSWGEAVNARLMSAKEFMRRYSDIRYAASMGYLHAPLRALDCLMMDLQPGSLAVQAGKLIGEREGEILRAKLLREQLLKLVAD